MAAPESAVLWSPEAIEDLVSKWAFLAREASPAVADQTLTIIEAAADRLREWPQSGRARDELIAGLRSAVAGGATWLQSSSAEGNSSQMNPALTIASMSLRELSMVLDWAAAEGWNPGLGDAAPFHTADPEGFLLGRLGGEPAAAISAVRYGEGFAFLGLYICRPEFRGRGYGMAMWKAAVEHVGGRTIGLDGVVEQQANYARSGFVYAHRNVRYGGSIGRHLPESHGVVPLGRVAREEVAAFDRLHFGSDRERFLSAWLDGTGGRTGLAHLTDGRLDGYGVIRDCREGAKVGPIFASSEGAARALLLALAATRPGATIYLDLPEPNADAVSLAESLGLTPRFETARMYRGPAPALPLDRIYGITSFELG